MIKKKGKKVLPIGKNGEPITFDKVRLLLPVIKMISDYDKRTA